MKHDEEHPHTQLDTAAELVSLPRLASHVRVLAECPRPAESTRLENCREYVTVDLQKRGWNVERHPFTVQTVDGTSLSGVNLIAEHADRPLGDGPRLCLGAHLDSCPETPGADDNASAVAALLELARLLPQAWPETPRLDLELVAFDLEEHGMLGGAQHAAVCHASGVDLRGMVSLEMLGYRDPRPQSQDLPKSLVGLYPDTGDFIAVVGNQNSAELIDAWGAGMQQVECLPVETLAVPDNGNLLQATRLSDHSPFWDAGYPALMITDTSFLRNPHYHLPSDTLETLDLDFLRDVSQGCLNAVRQILSNGLSPLSVDD